MTKFEEKLEILPIKTIQHPVGDTKYYTAVHVKTLIAQADEEIANLKSKLQQQALPVVPKCVAGAIAWDEQMDNSIAKNLKDIFTASDKYLKEAGLWIKNNPEKYIIARNIGYTVAKEKRYEVVFLEDDTTRQILMENNAGYYFIEEESENYGYWKQDFTEMEIKEINEKFWQLSVPVKDEQIEVEE